MSAYLVPPQQLGIMVSVFGAEAAHGSGRDKYTIQIMDLLDTNLKSLEDRYNKGKDNSFICNEWLGIDYTEYINQAKKAFKKCYQDGYGEWKKYTNPVQILKYCQNWEYQSCEYDNWKESEGYRVCSWIKGKAIDKLKGYEEAEWGYDGDVKFENYPLPQISLYDLAEKSDNVVICEVKNNVL